MIAALRLWLAGFGHPATPVMLPDPVRWTTWTAVEPPEFVANLNETETHDGYGWTLDDVLTVDHRGFRVRLYRGDGRYRSRDDSCRGL